MKLSPSNVTAFFLSLMFSLFSVSCEKPEPASDESTEVSNEAVSTADSVPAEKTEEPQERIKHLEVPDVTSYAQAKEVFLERTAEINGKKKLDNQELHEIHMSTYHLEKAIAYFAENSKGAKKEAAEKLAVVVEEVHLSSETFQPEEAKKHLTEFAKQAEAFTAKLK